MKILSIDWDYFMNCSIGDRLTYFPDGGNENIGIAMSNLIWSARYAFAKCTDFNLSSIKTRSSELDFLKKIVDKNKDRFCFACADSHKHLGDFILDTSMEKKFSGGIEITNIDHHHDTYGYGTSVNCGNWLNKVIEKFPETSALWIGNEDSEQTAIKNVTYSSNIKDADKEYDIIYLCRSSVWSCPHLDKEFSALSRFISKRSIASILREELPNRWDDDMKKAIDQQVEVNNNAMKKLVNRGE